MRNLRTSIIILNVIFFAALGAALAWPAEKRVAFAGFGAERIPKTIAGTEGRSYEFVSDQPLDKGAQEQLNAASIVSREYQEAGPDATPAPFGLTLIGGTDRSVIHDPRSCFRGAGWRIENDHNEVLPGTNINAHSCLIRQPNSNVGFDVLYLYVVDGAILNKVTQIRAEMVWNAFLGTANRPTFFFRCTRLVDLSTGSMEQKDHQRLQDFSAATWNAIGPQLLAVRADGK